jgi:hypothetical protein
MQYRVINVDTISSLERRVTEFISEGWIPQGGICTCYEGGNLRFYQVMIKTV